MKKSEHHVEISLDDTGNVKWLSIRHIINGEEVLIEQTMDEDGRVEFYTNGIKEESAFGMVTERMMFNVDEDIVSLIKKE